MKQVYLLDRGEIADLRRGKPFSIVLSNGITITLLYEGMFKGTEKGVEQSNGTKKNGEVRTNRTYTDEERRKAVALAEKLGSSTKAGKQLGIHDSLIYVWKKRLAKKDKKAGKTTNGGK